jgi:hypothetical protein
VFPWLSGDAVPWIDRHRWAWPVLLFLVLLPPLTTVGELVWRLRLRRSSTTHRA